MRITPEFHDVEGSLGRKGWTQGRQSHPLPLYWVNSSPLTHMGGSSSRDRTTVPQEGSPTSADTFKSGAEHSFGIDGLKVKTETRFSSHHLY